MNVVTFIHFLAMLLIAGATIRYIEMLYPDTWIGRSLGVIY